MRPRNAKKVDGDSKTYTVDLPFFQLNILILTRFFDGRHSRSFTNPLFGNSRLAKHYDQTLDIRDTTRQN